MREHDWEVYEDDNCNPIRSKKIKGVQQDPRLKHIYSHSEYFQIDDSEDFETGTWKVKCNFCGTKTRIINGKPLLYGDFLDCERMFAVHGIAIIMNS